MCAASRTENSSFEGYGLACGDATTTTDIEDQEETESDGTSVSSVRRSSNFSERLDDGREPSCPSVSPAEADIDIKEPLSLAIDSTGRAQVVQATKVLTCNILEALLARLSVLPATVGSYCTESVKDKAPERPPGVFVKPPPGLARPSGVAIGLVAPRVDMVQEDNDKISGEALSAAISAKSTPAAGHQHTIVWHVDAQKLTSSDVVIVSPRFEFTKSSCRSMPFRVMLCPKNVCASSGRVSFKRARSFGGIQIKVDAAASLQVEFILDVKLGQDFAEISNIAHDFGKSAVCTVPGSWNFYKAVDKTSQTLSIAVTITPR